MKKRIAVFKTDYGMIFPCWSGAEFIDTNTRISEYVDVDFPEIIEPALDHSDCDYE